MYLTSPYSEMSEKQKNSMILMRDLRTAFLMMVISCVFLSAETAKNACVVVWGLFFAKRLLLPSF